MAMSPKTRKILKRIGIGFGIYFIVFWVGTAAYFMFVPGAWEKYQKFQESRQASSNAAVTMGIMAGVLDAQSGAVKPSESQLDAMARRARNELATSPGPMFVEQFKQGYREGWRRAD